MYKDGFKAAIKIRPAHLFMPDHSARAMMLDKFGEFATLKKKMYAQEDEE